MIRKKILLLTCLLSAFNFSAMADPHTDSSQMQQGEKNAPQQQLMKFVALQTQLKNIEQNQESLAWARKVVQQLKNIKKNAIHVTHSENTPVTFLNFVDFLCHHCQDDLKKLAHTNLQKNDFGYMIYSVPIFQGDVASQYGLILNQLHKENPEALLSVLKALSSIERSKEALLEKVASLSDKINTTDFSDISAYKDHRTMLDTLGLGYVPVTFAVIKDEGRPVIVMLVKVDAMEELQELTKELSALSVDEKQALRKILAQ